MQIELFRILDITLTLNERARSARPCQGDAEVVARQPRGVCGKPLASPRACPCRVALTQIIRFITFDGGRGIVFYIAFPIYHVVK